MEEVRVANEEVMCYRRRGQWEIKVNRQEGIVMVKGKETGAEIAEHL